MKMFDRMIDRGTNCVPTSGMPPHPRWAILVFTVMPGANRYGVIILPQGFPTKESQRKPRQLPAPVRRPSSRQGTCVRVFMFEN
jgi:hypothetical protein